MVIMPYKHRLPNHTFHLVRNEKKKGWPLNPNLFDALPIHLSQIDGTTLVAAGPRNCQEMLHARLRERFFHLSTSRPVLPSLCGKKGHINGTDCPRGGFELNIRWKKRKRIDRVA